jgi:hypothetical protein
MNYVFNIAYLHNLPAYRVFFTRFGSQPDSNYDDRRAALLRFAFVQRDTSKGTMELRGLQVWLTVTSQPEDIAFLRISVFSEVSIITSRVHVR